MSPLHGALRRVLLAPRTTSQLAAVHFYRDLPQQDAHMEM